MPSPPLRFSLYYAIFRHYFAAASHRRQSKYVVVVVMPPLLLAFAITLMPPLMLRHVISIAAMIELSLPLMPTCNTSLFFSPILARTQNRRRRRLSSLFDASRWRCRPHAATYAAIFRRYAVRHAHTRFFAAATLDLSYATDDAERFC